MCYYATTDYRCGDWRWGNMKLRCARQHRMGETCGAKLIHHESIEKSNEDCRLCQDIAIKQRRLQKERDNVTRWSREGKKFAASIDKAMREAEKLEETIRSLNNKRPSVKLRMDPVGTPVGRVSTPSNPATAPDNFDGNTGGHPHAVPGAGYAHEANSWYSRSQDNPRTTPGGYGEAQVQADTYQRPYGNGPTPRHDGSSGRSMSYPDYHPVSR